MNNFLLVDGSNLLFQMFYGMPSRIVNSSGKAIHGTLGFTGALLRMIRMTHPRYLAVLFDSERNRERLELMPEYKAGRRDFTDMPEEETPFSQIPDIERVLDVIGGYHKVISTYEVDDIISSCVVRFAKSYDIVIASQDSDFFQLISEKVKVLRYRGGDRSIICDTAYVRERYGVDPCAFVDYKSLVGDPSDNIRGARGVGPKIAAGLLADWGDLENVIEHADKISRPMIRNSIIDDADRLRRNHRVIRLRGLVSPPFDAPPPFEFITNSVTTAALLREAGVM